MNHETRMKVIIRDMYTCVNCGKQVGLGRIQVAHKIRNGSGSIKWLQSFILNKDKKWLQENILDNPMNLATTCSLYCNDSQNIFFDEIKSRQLVFKIMSTLTE